MWEAIARNRRRSVLLVGAMGFILIGLGMLAGLVFGVGAWWGAFGALVLWGVLQGVAAYQGDQLLLLAAGAHEISRDDSPRLWNVVEEMTIAAGLAGSQPRIFVIDSDIPNAFAAGGAAGRASIAVTTGILRTLSRDELQGVVAHEMAHIKNEDVRFLTRASVLLGAIVLLSDVLLRATILGGGRRRLAARSGFKAQAALMIAAIVAAVLAPICARLFYFACSREREYLADACAARFTRYPPGLAGALEKISRRASAAKDVGAVVAPLFIVNPLDRGTRPGSPLLSTHPPTSERIRILRAMGTGAGYGEYEAAYQSVRGKSSGDLIDTKSLAECPALPTRLPRPDPEPREQVIERAREVADLIDRIAEYVILSCACGIRIKLPPEWNRPTISCPRCGVENSVPASEDVPEDDESAASASSVPVEAAEPSDESKSTESPVNEHAKEAAESPQQYQRRGESWESFRCRCGRTLQLSPTFHLPSVRCVRCKRSVAILPAEPVEAETTSS